MRKNGITKFGRAKIRYREGMECDYELVVYYGKHYMWEILARPCSKENKWERLNYLKNNFKKYLKESNPEKYKHLRISG